MSAPWAVVLACGFLASLFLSHTPPPGHLIPQGLRAVYKGQGPGCLSAGDLPLRSCLSKIQAEPTFYITVTGPTGKVGTGLGKMFS